MIESVSDWARGVTFPRFHHIPPYIGICEIGGWSSSMQREGDVIATVCHATNRLHNARAAMETKEETPDAKHHNPNLLVLPYTKV